MFRRDIVHSIIVILICVEPLFPSEINKSKAEYIANNFLKRKPNENNEISKESRNIFVIDEIKDPLNSTILAFLVKLQPKGFIIVSTNTAIEPIIAFSYTNDFVSEPDSENTLLDLLVKDLQLRNKATPYYSIEKVSSIDLKWNELINERKFNTYQNTFRQWPEEGKTYSGGWIEYQWTSNQFRKQLLPLDPSIIGPNGERYRTTVGCVPMAMSMVIDYYKYLGSVHFNESDQYISNEDQDPSVQIKIDDDSTKLDFPSFYKLNLYLDSLSYKYENGIPTTFINQWGIGEPFNKNDQASICFASGIAIKADYSAPNTGSSVRHIPDALKYKFNYYSAELREFIEGFGDDFNSILKSNMMNGLPAILGIIGNNSHAVVCDGYNSDDFYHLNFGTLAYQGITAWYQIPQGMPRGYNFILEAVINISPQRVAYNELLTTPNFINFSGIVTGQNAIKTILIENKSTTNFNVSSITCSDTTFTISTDNLNFSSELNNINLLKDGKQILYVKFEPTDIKEYQLNIFLKYSNSMGNEYFKNIESKGYGIPQNGTLINGGAISGILTKEKSPYYVCDNIFIPSNYSLRIEPGVKMFFNHYSLTIGQDAKIIAIGTKSNNITFTAIDTSLGWLGFDFLSTGEDDTLSYCQFTYGKVDVADVNRNFFQNGSIYCNDSSPYISNCFIAYNKGINGAGLSCENNSQTKIISNRIVNNYATSNGGAIHSYKASLTLVNNLITNNNAINDGGGIYFLNSSQYLIMNNIICNNSSDKNGGGLSSTNSYFNIINTIFYNNTAQNGSNLYLYDHNYMMILRNCLISEGLSSIYNPSDWMTFSSLKNKFQDPVFVNPTQGRGISFNSISADWRLSENSPCIDAGTTDKNDLLGYDEIPMLDIDGNLRIWDGNKDNISNIDIGVLEYNSPEAYSPKFISISDTIAIEDSLFSSTILFDGVPKPTYKLIDFPKGMFLNKDTGVMSWLPNNSNVGNIKINIEAKNIIGSNIHENKIKVININDPPIISNFPNQISLNPNSMIQLKLDDYVQDIDNPDSVLQWSAYYNKLVEINISSDNIVTIKSPLNCSGIDTIIFKVNDRELLEDNDTLLVSIAVSSISIDMRALPVKYILYQNYPNPFNSSTKICFDLPEPEYVSLKIYDLLGNEIMTLLNSHLSTGRYQIPFNNENLSSGVYLYRVNTKKFTDIKKLIIEK